MKHFWRLLLRLFRRSKRQPQQLSPGIRVYLSTDWRRQRAFADIDTEDLIAAEDPIDKRKTLVLPIVDPNAETEAGPQYWGYADETVAERVIPPALTLK